jgi:PAS domain S-box-containing protein
MPPMQFTSFHFESWSRVDPHELPESNDLAQKLFLASNDPILLLNPTAGEFLGVNPRASVMFGYSRQEFLRLSPRRSICIHEDEWKLLLDSVRNKREKWLRAMSCRLKSGRIIVRDILPSVVQIGGKPHILATIQDASQRQLTELLRSGAHFMRFSNAVAAGAALTPSVEHALRFCLRQICDYFHWVFAHSHIFSGRVLSARVPRDIWHFGLHDLAVSVQALVGAKQFFFPEEWYSHILAGPQAIMVNDFDSQPESLVKLEVQSAGLSSALVMPILVGGEVAGVCQYFSDQPMDRGPLFLNTMDSFTARLGQIIDQKLADETVRRLSNRLFRIQDEERRLLARELHDTTAQNIAAILMDLGVIGRSADVLTPEARHALSESLSLTRQSLQEIRSFSYLIHPPMLDELGLVSALRIFIEGFSQRSGMHVHLEAPVSRPKLPTHLESTVFRVIQEALTNARRHSGSSSADVKLRTTETELKLSVENETTRDLLWGQPDIQPAKIGVGMRSMHERVQHVGGRLDFHIGKNRTVLEAVFPLS